MQRTIHLSGVRQLTRNLDKVFDDIYEETVLRCKYHFTTKPKRAKTWWRRASKERVDLETAEWAERNALGVFFDLVSHLNMRIFVGPAFGLYLYQPLFVVWKLISRSLVLSSR